MLFIGTGKNDRQNSVAKFALLFMQIGYAESRGGVFSRELIPRYNLYTFCKVSHTFLNSYSV